LLRWRRVQGFRVGLVGTVASLSVLACEQPSAADKPPRPALPEASDFVCDGDRCTQRHVRLPDDGEWRCADFDGVAVCAGGEPAAGVVQASARRGYRCGARRGASRERVCVDPAPDQPPTDTIAYRCRFDAEHGLTRECLARAGNESRAPRELPSGAPDCWLDSDCGAACDRGFCAGATP
jgi:hypothetical protein